MNLDIKKKVAIHLLHQRNFSYVMVGFLMLVTSVLLVRLWTVEEHIIVIPSLNDPEKKYHMDGNHLEDSYFKDWASSLLGDLFTANPQTVDQKNKTFLQWSLSSSSLTESLLNSARNLKKDAISTAFYPETYQIVRSEKEIHVTGMFLTFFGRSLKPVETTKTFVLGWEIVHGGVVAIRSLKELKKEEIDEIKK